MQNLNPTRIIARRGRDMLLYGSVSLMGGLFVAAFGLFILILFTAPIFGLSIITAGGIAVLVGIGLMIRGLTYRKDNDAARVVGDLLSRELNQRFIYIRNLSRPGLGYIDAVLIGPPGALVFRVTDEPGVLLNEGSDWLERKPGRDYELSRKNYSRECIVDIHALRNHYAKRGLSNIPVYGIVVFTHPQVQLQTRKAVVPIAQPHTLMLVLRKDFLTQDRIDDNTVKAGLDAIYSG